MASYTPCSVLADSTMLWDSVVQHYTTCAHTPCILHAPNTPYSSTLLSHRCALRTPTLRTYRTARSLYPIVIHLLQTHRVSRATHLSRDPSRLERWCGLRPWGLRTMRGTRVIMECIVIVYTTVRVTYKALGSVAEPPSRPAPWRRAPGTGHRFASRLRLWAPIACKNKRQSALGVSGGERGPCSVSRP